MKCRPPIMLIVLSVIASSPAAAENTSPSDQVVFNISAERQGSSTLNNTKTLPQTRHLSSFKTFAQHTTSPDFIRLAQVKDPAQCFHNCWVNWVSHCNQFCRFTIESNRVLTAQCFSSDAHPDWSNQCWNHASWCHTDCRQ